MQDKGIKRFYICIITILLLLLSGCSSKPSLDLISSTVEINNDENRLGAIGITSGERAGEYIVPIALTYDFVLKNTGSNTLGSMKKPNDNFEFDDGIIVNIEPNQKLIEILEEEMLGNIFSVEEEGYLGMGKSVMPILEPNQEGRYSIDFILGALEENPDLKLAPSPDKLARIKEYAMEVTLIVTVEGEEIARFDLSEAN